MNIAKVTDGNHNYYYRAKWKQTNNATEHIIDCDTSTCTVDGLSQAEAYELSVKVCFAPYPGNPFEPCSLFSSPTIEYTLPLGKMKTIL